MKRSEIVFAILQIILDFFALILAAILAYSIRFSGFFLSFRPAVTVIPWQTYILNVLAMSVFWIVIFALAGLYPIGKPKKFISELGRIISASSTGFVAVTILLFLSKDVLSSRFIVLAAWALAILFVIVSHSIIRTARKISFFYGVGTHRIILMGDNVAEDLARGNLFSKFSGYKIVEFFRDQSEQVFNKILELKLNDKFDDLFFINPNANNEDLKKIKIFSDIHHIKFNYAADPFLISHRNIEISTFASIPIVELKKSRLDGWGRIFKRVFDVLISSFLLILLAPLFLTIFIIIKFTSSGPIVYKNERVGEDGKTFNTLKFRTMFSEYSIGKQFPRSEEALRYEKTLIEEHGIKSGPVYKIANDPRVTRLGRVLRRASLDELPQLWNVLRGEMSLVGPRPHQIREVEKYNPSAHRLLNIKPGITGMAQISGRSNLSFDEEARLDLYYIENWSPWLDLYILLKTPFVVISKKGAY